MDTRFNPFQPNSPAYTGMFVGRYSEVMGIDRVLSQTKRSNPSNILFVGDRGIGKSSLLLYAKAVASGSIRFDETHDFITLFITLTPNIDLKALALKIQDLLERELESTNALDKIRKLWKFAKNIQAVGVSIKEEDNRTDAQVIDDIVYSLASTIRVLITDSQLQEVGLTRKKDGIIIFIDEADKASQELQLGSFLKYLTETLIAEDAKNFSLILAGLPNIRDVLRESHESSLRLFQEYDLKPLTKDEVVEIIEKNVKESNQKSIGMRSLTVDAAAKKSFYEYSEGYPHFVQQLGYSTMEANTDDIIAGGDVLKGFFGRGGALERIGNAYYRHSYLSCSKEQKAVLKVIAEKWNDWITREEIIKKYSGNPKTLDSCLATLRSRNVLLKKEGSRGEYRLQWTSFAFWIRFQKEEES